MFPYAQTIGRLHQEALRKNPRQESALARKQLQRLNRPRIRLNARDFDFSIKAILVTKYKYPQIFIDPETGRPFPLYQDCPIAIYYSVEIEGPFDKFYTLQKIDLKSGQRKWTRYPIFSEPAWVDADFAGKGGSKLHVGQKRMIISSADREVWMPDKRRRRVYLQYAVEGKPGRPLSAEKQGFNTEAEKIAKQDVYRAYEEWFEKHKDELSSFRPQLRLDQIIRPIYSHEEIGGKKVSVIDPILHLPITIYALKALQSLIEGPLHKSRVDVTNIFNHPFYMAHIRPINDRLKTLYQKEIKLLREEDVSKLTPEVTKAGKIQKALQAIANKLTGKALTMFLVGDKMWKTVPQSAKNVLMKAIEESDLPTLLSTDEIDEIYKNGIPSIASEATWMFAMNKAIEPKAKAAEERYSANQKLIQVIKRGQKKKEKEEPWENKLWLFDVIQQVRHSTGAIPEIARKFTTGESEENKKVKEWQQQLLTRAESLQTEKKKGIERTVKRFRLPGRIRPDELFNFLQAPLPVKLTNDSFDTMMKEDAQRLIPAAQKAKIKEKEAEEEEAQQKAQQEAQQKALLKQQKREQEKEMMEGIPSLVSHILRDANWETDEAIRGRKGVGKSQNWITEALMLALPNLVEEAMGDVKKLSKPPLKQIEAQWEATYPATANRIPALKKYTKTMNKLIQREMEKNIKNRSKAEQGRIRLFLKRITAAVLFRAAYAVYLSMIRVGLSPKQIDQLGSFRRASKRAKKMKPLPPLTNPRY